MGKKALLCLQIHWASEYEAKSTKELDYFPSSVEKMVQNLFSYHIVPVTWLYSWKIWVNTNLLAYFFPLLDGLSLLHCRCAETTLGQERKLRLQRPHYTHTITYATVALCAQTLFSSSWGKGSWLARLSLLLWSDQHTPGSSGCFEI